MPTEQSSQSLRVALATNPDLRHKVQQAAALAAHNVLKEAGITVTAADVADAQSDIAALSVPSGAIKADTAGDIINGVSTAFGIAGLFGF